MKSDRHGKRTSAVEVTNVATSGFWLMVTDRELFVPFRLFPWFREATIGQLTRVQLTTAGHLRWPDLDIDLAIESIEHPDRFPLVSRMEINVSPRGRGSAKSLVVHACNGAFDSVNALEDVLDEETCRSTRHRQVPLR